MLLGAAHAATIEKPTSIIEEAFADTDLPMPLGPTTLWAQVQCQVNRLMCADFSSHRTLMKGGKYDCTVRFLSPTVLWVIVKKMKAATMRYWMRLALADHHGDCTAAGSMISALLLKERSSLYQLNKERSMAYRTSTLTRDFPERGEKQEILQGKSDELDSPHHLHDDSTRDDQEAKDYFWTITSEFIYRHHVVLRVKLYMPIEETFRIPIKYIDVTRTTHTSLDVFLEKYRRLLQRGWRKRIVRCMDRLHKIHLIERKAT